MTGTDDGTDDGMAGGGAASIGACAAGYGIVGGGYCVGEERGGGEFCALGGDADGGALARRRCTSCSSCWLRYCNSSTVPVSSRMRACKRSMRVTRSASDTCA